MRRRATISRDTGSAVGKPSDPSASIAARCPRRPAPGPAPRCQRAGVPKPCCLFSPSFFSPPPPPFLFSPSPPSPDSLLFSLLLSPCFSRLLLLIFFSPHPLCHRFSPRSLVRHVSPPPPSLVRVVWCLIFLPPPLKRFGGLAFFQVFFSSV